MEENLNLPQFIQGKIIHGVKRGTELGIPTANLEENSFKNLKLKNGVYFGWAKLCDKDDEKKGNIYKFCASLGCNPFFENKNRTFECHILNKFENLFYDHQLKVVICGKIRPLKTYNNLEELIKDIKNDISITEDELSKDKYSKFKNHNFLM